jgi:hypothetical protein
MKQWKDARSRAELVALIDRTLRHEGTVTAAAKTLGISRRHLTRFLCARRETTETRSLTETRLAAPPLTRAARGPRVSAQKTTVDATIELPGDLLQWVEQLALRWKHAGAIARASKSAVVVAALLEFRQKVEAAAEVVKRGMNEGR